MKARVKATGEIVNVYNWGQPTFRADNGDVYQKSELDFDVEDENNPNYWTRLEHQYAGMAMQQLVHLVNVGYEYVYEETALIAMNFAHALVEMMKEKEERK